VVSNTIEKPAVSLSSVVPASGLTRSHSPRDRAVSEVITVPPLPWSGAKPGKCYENVRRLIKDRGGDFVYGWALTEYGPFRRVGWYPPPLYRRWLNHVVWRDVEGKIWEVTPGLNLDDRRAAGFNPTDFMVDPEAVFEINSENDWRPRPCRYVPARPEGEPTAYFLERAQHTTNPEVRQQWLQHAILALEHQGFRPLEWKVELDGEKTGSIWLIAE